MSFYVYILKCNDGSYYTGRSNYLPRRITEHQDGVDTKAYTHSRRPVVLVWAQEFVPENEAFRFEHQIKGWSRKKKEALIRDNWDEMKRVIAEQKRR